MAVEALLACKLPLGLCLIDNAIEDDRAKKRRNPAMMLLFLNILVISSPRSVFSGLSRMVRDSQGDLTSATSRSCRPLFDFCIQFLVKDLFVICSLTFS
jgi:hypothetical protein